MFKVKQRAQKSYANKIKESIMSETGVEGQGLEIEFDARGVAHIALSGGDRCLIRREASGKMVDGDRGT